MHDEIAEKWRHGQICGQVGVVPTLRHIDALLGTCWRWDEDDDDASAAHACAPELSSPLDDLAERGD